jgi:carbohydrate-selective porin OprB
MCRVFLQFGAGAGRHWQRTDAGKRGSAAKLQPSIASSFPALAQFQKGLLDLGYNLQWNYAAEEFGNLVGGVKQGAIYAGLCEMSVDGDHDRIAGLS